MANNDWEKKWEEFKKYLPHREQPYAKRNWGSSLHSLCSYQGKLKPSIAHHLVDAFSNPGDTVLDPFSGSGTIPYEAALQERRAVAFDVSDMAVAISQAKISQCDRDVVNSVLASLQEHIESETISAKSLKDAREVSFNQSIEHYFEDETFREVLLARDFFTKSRSLESPEWCIVFASALHILHGNRPYALSRRSHPLTPYAPSGPFERKPFIPLLKNKVEKSLAEKGASAITPGRSYKQDVLGEWKQVGMVDAIVTSPPFVASTRFYMTNWMRFWFAGWGREDFDLSVHAFLETQQRKQIQVYERVFERFAEHLSPKGVIVLHVGKNKVMDMGTTLANLAKTRFKVQDLFVEPVDDLERHGIKDKGGTTDHQYLVLTLC